MRYVIYGKVMKIYSIFAVPAHPPIDCGVRVCVCVCVCVCVYTTIVDLYPVAK